MRVVSGYVLYHPWIEEDTQPYKEQIESLCFTFDGTLAHAIWIFFPVFLVFKIRKCQKKQQLRNVSLTQLSSLLTVELSEILLWRYSVCVKILSIFSWGGCPYMVPSFCTLTAFLVKHIVQPRQLLCIQDKKTNKNSPFNDKILHLLALA